MANSGLIVLGILMILGIFFFTNIMISPQQRSQIELANKACGSSFLGIPIGQIGQALSPEIARECRNVSGISQIFSIAPFGYLIGFVLLIAGLAIGGEKKETIVREVVKPMPARDYELDKDIDFEEELKSEKKEIKYCRNCGAKVKGKYCSECGERI